MPPRRRQHKPFADPAGEDAAAHPASTAPAGEGRWPAPIHDKHWIDQQGNRWHMRGGELIARQARRLLRRPDVAVLHVYGVAARQLTGSDRDALARRIEQFFSGDTPPMSDFAIAEFRDELHRVMLVVQESC